MNNNSAVLLVSNKLGLDMVYWFRTVQPGSQLDPGFLNYECSNALT